MKAIIIGGGVGGLCTAIALQNQGVEVELYEQAPQLRAAGAGLTLWANAVRALRKLNAQQALETGYALDSGNAIRKANGTILSALDAQRLTAAYGETTLAVHRVDFMQALVAQLQTTIHYDKRLTRYQQDEQSVTATFDDSTQTSGDLLIGADGIHSIVRQQMFPHAQPVTRGYASWRAVIPFAHERVQGNWGESWGKGARFGIVPLTDGRVYWFAPVNRPPDTPFADPKATLTEIFGDWHTPIPDLIAETPDSVLLYNDILDIEPLSTWVDGRVVLLGDAAHAMTPNMGQGACQAIEDAVALADALRQTTQLSVALATYDGQRRPHTRRVMMQSRRIGQVGQLESPLLMSLRDAVVRAIPSSMTLRQLDFVLAN